ncbi:hypothetical protein [Ralstonia edaphi]|uniref:hypothetical protein n=1 Tax=Ralstonia edaphi TaxID=3058599 RepID=UPI00292D318B|nr:hypothetical protein [Ralstonia sp. LMG 6871]
MRRIATALALAFFVAAQHPASAADAVAISPDQLTNATIEIRGSDIYYELRTPAGIRNTTIATETEKAIHLETADYDFSGRQGFAFWSIDEGQGVYKIYRVFTFSRKRNDFVEHHPRCGDAFLNLRVDAQRKRLISTFFENNIPKSCVSRLESD